MKTKPKAGQTRTRNHRNPTGKTHRTVSAGRAEQKRLKSLESDHVAVVMRVNKLEHRADAFDGLNQIVLALRERVEVLERVRVHNEKADE